jgi:hypothetical protein
MQMKMKTYPRVYHGIELVQWLGGWADFRTLRLFRQGRRPDHARQCSTLVVTQRSGDVSSLKNGLVDAVKADGELRSLGDESALVLTVSRNNRCMHVC